MSKIKDVRRALQNNSAIVIVKEVEKIYLPNRNGFWSHTIDFFVAPKTSGLYTVRELQEFMMSLVPGVNPSQIDCFEQSDSSISFGKLYFDECIGEEVIIREVTLTDEDVSLTEGFRDGKMVIKSIEEVKRRTWVRLFPNLDVANAAFKGGNQFSITMEELKKYL